ncbi:MAG: carboxypeptidase regulatory-like domain-containing protein [Bacteroidetes bacterium]|nr:carboxypeptidase regulatory-like domain-containing protein [Bacteroidota bacterium]
MKNKFVLPVVVLTSLLMSGFLSSCKKEQDTLARITVLDTSGNPFAGAEVRVYGEPTLSPHPEMIMDKTLVTDSQGEVIFDFTADFKLGQAGFTVLNIEINSGDTLAGEGIIKIEEEKMNDETLVIQPL